MAPRPGDAFANTFRKQKRASVQPRSYHGWTDNPLVTPVAAGESPLSWRRFSQACDAAELNCTKWASARAPTNGDQRLLHQLLDECDATGDQCQAISAATRTRPLVLPRIIYFQRFPHGGKVRIASFLPDQYIAGPEGY
jgi:hypothetical protein